MAPTHGWHRDWAELLQQGTVAIPINAGIFSDRGPFRD
jgi:hypothetical protein